MLKKQFPDGVPLKVLDKVDADWDPKKFEKIQNIESADEQKLKPMKMVNF